MGELQAGKILPTLGEVYPDAADGAQSVSLSLVSGNPAFAEDSAEFFALADHIVGPFDADILSGIRAYPAAHRQRAQQRQNPHIGNGCIPEQNGYGQTGAGML